MRSTLGSAEKFRRSQWKCEALLEVPEKSAAVREECEAFLEVPEKSAAVREECEALLEVPKNSAAVSGNAPHSSKCRKNPPQSEVPLAALCYRGNLK